MLDERGPGVYVNQIISPHFDRSAVAGARPADCLSGDANARSTAGGSGRSADQPARTHPTTADANPTDRTAYAQSGSSYADIQAADGHTKASHTDPNPADGNTRSANRNARTDDPADTLGAPSCGH